MTYEFTAKYPGEVPDTDAPTHGVRVRAVQRRGFLTVARFATRDAAEAALPLINTEFPGREAEVIALRPTLHLPRRRLLTRSE
jgi:hypothetical protein